MSKKKPTSQHPEQPNDEDKAYQELLALVESKRENLQAERKTKNPDGRLTPLQLIGMRNLIEGLRFTADGKIEKINGIGDIKSRGHELFITKLSRNLREVRNWIEVIQGVLPQLTKEEAQKQKEFEAAKTSLRQKNADVPPGFKGEITDDRIRHSGNWEIYQDELARLEADYRDLLDRIKEIESRQQEIFQQPLARCDFDLIMESEIPAEVSPNERQVIWPMIYHKEEEEDDCRGCEEKE